MRREDGIFLWHFSYIVFWKVVQFIELVLILVEKNAILCGVQPKYVCVGKWSLPRGSLDIDQFTNGRREEETNVRSITEEF